MARPLGREQRCGASEAGARLAEAEAFLARAGSDASASSEADMKAAISNAVLAGIAASDAACCKALGRRFRGQDHKAAAKLLKAVHPGGPAVGRQFLKLLDLKDDAQYGFTPMSASKLKSAHRSAEALVDFAREVLRR